MSRKFNVILDNPPEKNWPSVVEKTDFKQVLYFFRLMDDKEISEERKPFFIQKLFFEKQIPNDPDIWEKIIFFVSCNEENTEESGKKVFDYNVDHGRVFAAFWQTYKIDLRTTNMHWWTFCELFQNLPDETKLMQVIDIRSKKPDKKDSAEYKAQLRKMQNRVRLDDGQDALERAFDRWV